MSFMGLAPFGSLLFGGLANIIGAPNTLLIGGCCILAGTLVFARKFSSVKGMVHRAYVKKGMMPDNVSKNK
jgi:hypothetical protein